MSSPSSSKTPWLIVGALGCLALCLCIALAGGAILLLTGANSVSLLTQLGGASSPTLAPLPSVTRSSASSSVSSSSATRTGSATVAPPKSASSSSSSTAQCPPAPALAAGILFNDDFGSQDASECNGWLLAPGENVDYTWSKNKYTVSVNKSNYLGFDWPDGEYTNFAVETEAQPTSNGVTDYGVAFHISGPKDARSYYMFGLTTDGEYYVQERLDGEWVNDDPVSHTPSSAIKQGKAKNTIGVIARGNTYALYINHVLVDTFTDDSLNGKGMVGIFAGSDKTNAVVTFSRFTVLTPDKAQADWR